MAPPRWLIIIVAAWLGWLYRNPVSDPCAKFPLNDSPDDMSHLVAIVTGATGGLGFATVEKLIQLGVGKVYVAGRSLDKAKETVHGLGDHPAAIPAELDLANLKSVVDFAREFSLTNDRLDILINNAAVVRSPYFETANGFEIQMGVNHLGHYLLTRLLVPKVLNSTSGGKIIHVASRSSDWGEIDPTLWRYSMTPPKINAGQFYGNSKIAQVVFATDLARRLKRLGSKATSNAVHPGVVITDATRYVVPKDLQFALPVFSKLMTSLAILDSPEAGIATQIAVALSPDFSTISGAFLSKCAPRHVSQRVMFDQSMMELVWNASHFFVDPENILLGPGIQVRPMEEWTKYVPPSEVTSFGDFAFESKFAEWKQRFVATPEEDSLAEETDITKKRPTLIIEADEEAYDATGKSCDSNKEQLNESLEREKACQTELDQEQERRAKLEEELKSANELLVSLKNDKVILDVEKTGETCEKCQMDFAKCESELKMLKEQCTEKNDKEDEEDNITKEECQQQLEQIKLSLTTEITQCLEKQQACESSCQAKEEECQKKTKALDEKLLSCNETLSKQDHFINHEKDQCQAQMSEINQVCEDEKQKIQQKLDHLQSESKSEFEKMRQDLTRQLTSLEEACAKEKTEFETAQQTWIEEKDSLEKNTIEQLAIVKADLFKCDQAASQFQSDLEGAQNQLAKCKLDSEKQIQELVQLRESDRQQWTESQNALEKDIDACEKRLKKSLESMKKTKDTLEECRASKNEMKEEVVEELRRQGEVLEMEVRDELDKAKEKIASLVHEGEEGDFLIEQGDDTEVTEDDEQNHDEEDKDEGERDL